jgi:hypothetical protein
MREMDETRLREMYKSDRVARAFFDHMVRRERNQSMTEVEHILVLLNAHGENRFSRRDITELFKELQQLGCGRFVPGRRGSPSRFVWDVGSLSAMRSIYLKDLGAFVLLTFQKLSELFGRSPDTRVVPEIEGIQNNMFSRLL